MTWRESLCGAFTFVLIGIETSPGRKFVDFMEIQDLWNLGCTLSMMKMIVQSLEILPRRLPLALKHILCPQSVALHDLWRSSLRFIILYSLQISFDKVWPSRELMGI